eukprot:127093_1
MELDQFKPKFKDMRLGELLSYSDKDINDLCEEFDIKMPFKKRLADAIHVLQANKMKIQLLVDSKGDKINKNNNKLQRQDTTPISRTILSAEEEKAFDAIDERYQEVVQSIEDNQLSINKLKENHSNCKSQINAAFDSIITKLNNRRQQLLERLNFEGNKKMSVIKANKEKLINYKTSIESARSDADKLTMDVTVDRKTRKFRILQIEKYIYKYNITNQVSLSTKGHIDDNLLKFDCKSETASKALKFVNSYGNVLVNEKPLAPVVNIVGVGLTRCKIQFKKNPNSNPNVEIPKQWIVEYKLYTTPKPKPKPKPKAKSKLKSKSNDEKEEVLEEEKEEKFEMLGGDDLDIDSIGNLNLNQWRPKAKLENVNEYVMDGLSANNKYSIRICCSNNNGWSDYSKIINIQTKAIEGGIDSKILDLKEKKKLLQMIADKFDEEMVEKAMDIIGNNDGNR